MTKPALLMTGELMPLIMRGCEAAFEVHRYWEAPDRAALLKRVGPDIKAICTGTVTGVKTDEAMIAACPNLEVISNFGVGYESVDVAAAASRSTSAWLFSDAAFSARATSASDFAATGRPPSLPIAPTSASRCALWCDWNCTATSSTGFCSRPLPAPSW